MTIINYDTISRALLEAGDDDTQEIAEIVLEAAAEASETDAMSYLFKLDEYMDDAGVYVYKGWLDMVVAAEPIVDRFWVTYKFYLPEGSDVRAARQIPGPHGVGKVTFDKVSRGNIVTIMILRRALDELEFRNRREAGLASKPMADAEQVVPADQGMP